MASQSAQELGFIFDWDGVVVDSSRQHEESWERLAEQEGLELFEGHFKKGFGKRNELIIREFLKWSQDPSEIERLGDEKERHYREIVKATGLEALPGVPEFLAELDRLKLPRAVGSSTPRENILTVMETIGLPDAFTRIVAAADVRRGKPDPEVFLKAAALIRRPPERCVVFEDSLSGIEAGVAGGMKVVALATTNDRETLEKTDAHVIVDSFEQLSVDRLAKLF